MQSIMLCHRPSLQILHRCSNALIGCSFRIVMAFDLKIRIAVLFWSNECIKGWAFLIPVSFTVQKLLRSLPNSDYCQLLVRGTFTCRQQDHLYIIWILITFVFHAVVHMHWMKPSQPAWKDWISQSKSAYGRIPSQFFQPKYGGKTRLYNDLLTNDLHATREAIV